MHDGSQISLPSAGRSAGHALADTTASCGQQVCHCHLGRCSPHLERWGIILPMAMPSPATQTDREVLAGIVERVTFHSVGHRFLRIACEGARAPRSRHHCRPRRHDLRRRMDHGLGRLGQRPHPWPAVQGAVYAHLGTQFRRGHREVSRLGHDPRNWSGLRQEDGQGFRGEGLRHHRGRAGSVA